MVSAPVTVTVTAMATVMERVSVTDMVSVTVRARTCPAVVVISGEAERVQNKI
jgi:hypothetical protein